jgi:hypothetical protein
VDDAPAIYSSIIVATNLVPPASSSRGLARYAGCTNASRLTGYKHAQVRRQSRREVKRTKDNLELIRHVLLRIERRLLCCASCTLFSTPLVCPPETRTPTLRKGKGRSCLERNVSYNCKDAAPYRRQPNATPTRTLAYTKARSLLPCWYWTRNATIATT